MKVVATNRKAKHMYEVASTLEAGIVLQGGEVKSLRQGSVNIADSYARVSEGELYLLDMHIAPYEKSGYVKHDPQRPRKLLVTKRELKRLIGAVSQRGFTLVPLKLYFNERGIAKVELALCRGKKLPDRREAIKRRDLERELHRRLKP